MNDELTDFPCTACGLCCKRVGFSPQTAWLNRGDGICRHYDEVTKRCTIYEDRPLVCRVKDYYRLHLAEQITWNEFVEKNLEICKKFQEEDSTH